ncbi:tumor necrosis factor ligand superfamily member 6 [Brachyhypopomus gauderio]|uniref:tumor necrosis factor ligand superfamily member 6 n=1 Tax=Brachyhypopomus gauderio TaxID=698409 RepID=UPI004041C8F7
MSGNRGYPYPPVFTVDTSGGFPQHHYPHHQQPRPLQTQGAGRGDPVLVPCWTFPPAHTQFKRKSCRGMTSAGATLLVMVFLTVFAALGLGAYQIWRLQTEVVRMKQEMHIQNESGAPQRLVGTQSEHVGETKHTQAAHLIGKIQDKASKTLRWEQSHSRAFTEGVVYRDGGLRVNQTGLYFVYSRVEFLSNECRSRDSLFHTVYVRRDGHPLTLMSDHKEGFCRSGVDVWTAGSNLGSVQQLQQGDWVLVNVSRPAWLSTDHHSNFFGLFKLP